MSINIYYLGSGFIHLLFNSHLKLVAVVFAGIFGLLGMAIYLAAIVYLVVRKNKKATHLLALTGQENRETADGVNNRSLYSLPREDIVNMQLPQRINAVDVD